MPYPRKHLNDYETVALDLHPHWWYFAEPAFALVVSVVIGIVAMTSFDGTIGTIVRWVALIAIGVSVLWMIGRYARWSTTNFVITSDRLIYRSGVVAKSGIEIPLERVNNVLFNQSVFERIIGAGDLLIESGGEAGQQRFSDIKHPGRVQNLIHAQMETNSSRMFAGNGGTDVASQLEKLEGMLERGTLTRDEFEREKQRLLGG